MVKAILWAGGWKGEGRRWEERRRREESRDKVGKRKGVELKTNTQSNKPLTLHQLDLQDLAYVPVDLVSRSLAQNLHHKAHTWRTKFYSNKLRTLPEVEVDFTPFQRFW